MSSEKIIVKIDPDLEEIIPTFLSNRESDITKLNNFFSENDVQQIQVIAHKLAGNAGSYGFDDLGKIGHKMEEACKENKVQEIEALIKEYSDYISRLEVSYSE